jgi:hypothetical protein
MNNSPEHSSVTRLSYSSLSKFNTCPKQWEARYLLKVEEPPNEFKFYGLVDHKVKELYFKSKLENDPLSSDEVLDLYESVWNGDLNSEDFSVNRKEIKFLQTEEKVFMQGLALIEQFLEKEKIKPAEVEAEYTREIDFGPIKSFVARIDLVAKDGTVIDFKNTYQNITTAYNPTSVKYHLQPSSYAYAMNREIRFKFVVMQRRERKLYTRGTERTQSDIDWMGDKYIPGIAQQIQAGIFPATPGNHCNYCPIRKSCGYRA